MDSRRFDALTASLAPEIDRRSVALRFIAAAAAVVLGRQPASAVKKKKKKKKRCKRPPALGTPCGTTRDCCKRKTGRICQPNEKTIPVCDTEGNVCCLPPGEPGCDNDCDCCFRNTICFFGICRLLENP